MALMHIMGKKKRTKKRGKMENPTEKESIINGKTALGLELGSTRIKAVLIDEYNKPIASGSYEWSNSLLNGVWTYSLDEVWIGIKESYKELKNDVKRLYDLDLKNIGAIGISAMMHGYLVFDKHNTLLTPFRTWRNNTTEEASMKLTEIFNYPIPQRWCIAHLYQAVINKEKHVKDIDFMTTLAGYVHWKLTGEKIIGIGDASGMFPIDLKSKRFNDIMLKDFEVLKKEGEYCWELNKIMPKVKVAGEKAGKLTDMGAKLLDPTGELGSGILFCPPEGDAGTGMIATNSIRPRTGNVSAGTSVFAMVVLEDELKKVHEEIDQVTTPNGNLVAMVHSNNCTTELNAWVRLFKEILNSFGMQIEGDELYARLYNKALDGDADCGGLLSYGYHSGEHITGFEEGRPLFVRKQNSIFNLSNFMRMNLYSALATLKIGLDILFHEEGIKMDMLIGHGGFFKTKGVGQQILADAINANVSVMETAGEGGAWGIAVLAGYVNEKEIMNLDEYLNKKVFNLIKGSTMEPKKIGVEGFNQFMKRYKSGLMIEKKAVEILT